jgi:hypothetical protein
MIDSKESPSPGLPDSRQDERIENRRNGVVLFQAFRSEAIAIKRLLDSLPIGSRAKFNLETHQTCIIAASLHQKNISFVGDLTIDYMNV